MRSTILKHPTNLLAALVLAYSLVLSGQKARRTTNFIFLYPEIT